jgi:transcriptional regulator with XRE-family HTH domain
MECVRLMGTSGIAGDEVKQNKRFAAWFRMARSRSELTQEALAERLGVSQPTIGYWEREGRESMTPEEVRSLAVHLRVTPVEIAAALGYPTVAAPPARPEQPEGDDPVFIATEIARLSSRLSALLEAEEGNGAGRATRAHS